MSAASVICLCGLVWERWRGGSVADWRRWLVLVLAVRSAVLVVDIVRGNSAWQRAVIPAAALLKLAIHPQGGQQSMLLGIGVAASELLGICIVLNWLWPRQTERRGILPEDRIAAGLSPFVPERAANWIAAESVVLGSAVLAICRGLRVDEPAGYGYAAASTFRMLPLIVILSGPPETLLLRQLFHITNGYIDLGLIIVQVWSILWLYGIYVTMRKRPHVFTAGWLEAHQGILKRTSIPVCDIRTVRAFPDAPRQRCPRDTARLTVRGVPCVRLELTRPVLVKSLWGEDRQATALYLPVADPSAFMDALPRGCTTAHLLPSA